MNRIVRHKGARAVAHLLIVALMAPFFGSISGGVAYGQYNHLSRQLTVVVLDMYDVSGEQAVPELAAWAEEELWEELHQSRWFLPVPQRDVEAEVERSNFNVPLSVREQQELATLLSAHATATGYVRTVEVGGSPRVATVDLQVFLLDALSGEYINGATIRESSDPMPGFEGPDSTLVREAVAKAAAEAVDVMGRYEIPEGYVITEGEDDQIRISLGEREGVDSGDRFVVIGRTTDMETDETFPMVQGQLVVREVRTTYSICRRWGDSKGHPVHVGDFVRGLYYDEPLVKPEGDTFMGPDPIEPKREESRTRKNLPKVLGILALLVVFGILISNNKSNAKPGTALQVAGVNIRGLPNAINRVQWSAPSSLPTVPQTYGGYTVGYEVHRGRVPNFPVTPNSLQAVLEGGALTQFDDDSTAVATGFNTTLSTSDTNGIVSFVTTPSDATVTWDLQPDSFTYDYLQTPPQPGTKYYYAIRVISKRATVNPFPEDMDAAAGELIISVPYYAGPVTTIEPPVLQFPPDRPDPGSTDVNLDTTLFQWEAVAGADTYVIELSTDRSFAPKVTLRSNQILMRATPGSSVTHRFVGTGGQSPSELFANVRAPIYWRVGARASDDVSLPVDGSGRQVDYVFSLERSFESLDLPPSAP
ncbi:MAG: hypothetical protein ACOX6M_02885 [Armatimonadota bacterium]|jgi:hypothetical protein